MERSLPEGRGLGPLVLQRRAPGRRSRRRQRQAPGVACRRSRRGAPVGRAWGARGARGARGGRLLVVPLGREMSLKSEGWQAF